MKKIGWMMTLLLVSMWTIESYSESLTIVMDYYPPFSYEENGEIKGVSTQVVKAVLQEAGVEATIKQYPFARAYDMTQKEDNIFEYCVARTPEREKLFQWVGVVTPATHGLIALKARHIRIQSLEDLKHYRIGTVFEDIVDQYLRGKQQQLGLQLERVNSYELNMKKLFGERFDLLGSNLFSAMYLAQKLGNSVQDIELVYTFEELTTDYYLVTSLKTSDELVQKLRTAFETIQHNGVYQTILSKYLRDTP